MHRRRKAVLAIGGAAVLGASLWGAGPSRATAQNGQVTGKATATPIRHVVVIFQENVSFDHYFGTYPTAANSDGQTFTAASGTPAVDGLLPATDPSIPSGLQHTSNLLTDNPNSAAPARLDSTPDGVSGGPGGLLTCDQDHDYSDEQQAYDSGKMDHFVESVGTDGGSKSPAGVLCNPKIVMDYYDGNTVTAMWNYAQQYAMSDNSYGTVFGPSAPGAIDVTSGVTSGIDLNHIVNNPSIATPTSPNGELVSDGTATGLTMEGDPQPYWDDCSTRDAVGLTGKNIGDELNAAGLSWGWFQGGMRPTTSYADALTATGHTGQSTSTFIPDEFKSAGFNKGTHASNQGLCDAVHAVGTGLGATLTSAPWGYKNDYIAHHEPFMYYPSTANPHHLTVATDSSGMDTLAGLGTIGTDTQSYVGGVPQFDTPNHNYDSSDFDQLVSAINSGALPPTALPAVSYLKAPGYQDGHAGYSDPEDEQQFVAHEINSLMAGPDWPSTAVVINYDDSDGWYDHANSGVVNPSMSAADNLSPTNLTLPTSGVCGPNPQTPAPLGGAQGRCGFGPRLPMIVISPFARHNAVDHNLSDQSSVVNFIEYNWGLPAISGSADQVLAGTDAAEGVPFDLAGLFSFHGRTQRLFLDPITGQPVSTDTSGG